MCPIANNIAPIENIIPNLSQLTVNHILIVAQKIETPKLIIAKNIKISAIKFKIVLIISIILQKIK